MQAVPRVVQNAKHTYASCQTKHQVQTARVVSTLRRGSVGEGWMEASRKRFIGALWEKAAGGGGGGEKNRSRGCPPPDTPPPRGGRRRCWPGCSSGEAHTQPASSRPPKSIKSRGEAQQRGTHAAGRGDLLHSPNRSGSRCCCRIAAQLPAETAAASCCRPGRANPSPARARPEPSALSA